MLRMPELLSDPLLQMHAAWIGLRQDQDVAPQAMASQCCHGRAWQRRNMASLCHCKAFAQCEASNRADCECEPTTADWWIVQVCRMVHVCGEDETDGGRRMEEYVSILARVLSFDTRSFDLLSGDFSFS